MTKNLKFTFCGTENAVGKERSTGYQHFSLFPQSFLKPFHSGSLKVRIVWQRLHKINQAEKLKFVLVRVENIVGKGENAGYQHFVFFPQCFQKASFSGSLTLSHTKNFRLFQLERVCRR